MTEEQLLVGVLRNLYNVLVVAILQQEFNELGALIPFVHRDVAGRMNALEYVHDIMGENEREHVLPEDDITPPPSGSKQADEKQTSERDDSGVASLANTCHSHQQANDDVPPTIAGSTNGSPHCHND